MLRLVVEDLGKTLILASIFKKLATLVIMGKINVKFTKIVQFFLEDGKLIIMKHVQIILHFVFQSQFPVH